MKDTQVYINDELIDLVPGQAIAMTYQLSDIGDLKNQRANFSNVFKAARSKENERKLGFVSDLNSTDKRPYRLLPARIIIDGEDVVTNGYATIKEVDKYYHILVYSGLLDLYERIGDRKLSDLDLSEFDHVFNTTTMQTLFTASSGICYPLIDYGHLIMNRCTTDYMRFSIYVHEIYERILTGAGFEFSGNFFDHPHYSKLLLPFVNEKMTNKAAAEAGDFEATTENYPVTNTNIFTTVGGFTVIAGNVGGCFAGNVYTVGAYAVRGKFNFDGQILGNAQKTALRLVSSTKGIIAYAKQEITGGGISAKLTVPNIDYQAGEVITLQVQHNNAAGVTVSGTFKFVQDIVVPFNGFLPVAENMPNMKQKDFIKAIAQIYGLIYDIDLETSKVRVRFFDDIITNKAAAKDWSTKLDLSIQDKKTFTLDFAQVNKFAYNNGTEPDEEDSETVAAAGNVPYSLGRGVILSDNHTAPQDKDAVSLPFAATEEIENTDVLGFGEALTVPRIKMFTPTNVVTELTGEGGVNDTPTPFYLNSRLYGAPPVYSTVKIYGGTKRVKYNGAVWEWQSSESTSNKEPGVALDNGDNGTNYAGLPYWLPIDIEQAYILKQSIKVKPRLLLATGREEQIILQSEQHAALSDIVTIPTFAGLDFETRIAENYKVVQDTANDTKCVRAYFTLTPEDIKTLDHLLPVYVGYYANFFYISRIDKYQQDQSTAVELVKI
jgi:hypothetical protein